MNSSRVSADVVAQSVGSELVLLDMQSELYLSLNASGMLIWRGLEAGRTDQEIEADLVSAFPSVSGERLRGDLIRLLEQLHERKLLRSSANGAESGS